MGWSGGGSLSLFYQAQAERPSITHTPAGDPYDLTDARLQKVDGFGFALHPLGWWQQFDPLCRIRMLPWDVMSSDQERELLWWDPLASGIYRLSGWFEQQFPTRAARLTQYPLIVLDKR